jgi:hypothetical protein
MSADEFRNRQSNGFAFVLEPSGIDKPAKFFRQFFWQFHV